MNRAFKIFLWTCILTISAIHHSSAAELSGMRFDERFSIQGKEMILKGLGLKTMLGIKVFVAGFYVDHETKDPDYLNDIAKRVEVAYLFPVPAKRLAKETRRRMRLNTTQKEYDAIVKRIDQMDAYFFDLKPQDRYTLTYVPNYGTIFALNKKEVGIIPGADFSRALFAVWIGKDPLSQKLKRTFLGEK